MPSKGAAPRKGSLGLVAASAEMRSMPITVDTTRFSPYAPGQALSCKLRGPAGFLVKAEIAHDAANSGPAHDTYMVTFKPHAPGTYIANVKLDGRVIGQKFPIQIDSLTSSGSSDSLKENGSPSKSKVVTGALATPGGPGSVLTASNLQMFTQALDEQFNSALREIESSEAQEEKKRMRDSPEKGAAKRSRAADVADKDDDDDDDEDTKSAAASQSRGRWLRSTSTTPSATPTARRRQQTKRCDICSGTVRRGNACITLQGRTFCKADFQRTFIKGEDMSTSLRGLTLRDAKIGQKFFAACESFQDGHILKGDCSRVLQFVVQKKTGQAPSEKVRSFCDDIVRRMSKKGSVTVTELLFLAMFAAVAKAIASGDFSGKPKSQAERKTRRATPAVVGEKNDSAVLAAARGAPVSVSAKVAERKTSESGPFTGDKKADAWMLY